MCYTVSFHRGSKPDDSPALSLLQLITRERGGGERLGWVTRRSDLDHNARDRFHVSEKHRSTVWTATACHALPVQVMKFAKNLLRAGHSLEILGSGNHGQPQNPRTPCKTGGLNLGMQPQRCRRRRVPEHEQRLPSGGPCRHTAGLAHDPHWYLMHVPSPGPLCYHRHCITVVTVITAVVHIAHARM